LISFFCNGIARLSILKATMASTEVLSPMKAMDGQMSSHPPVEARRSSRARKAPVRYVEDDANGTYQPTPTPVRKKAKLNGSGSSSPPAMAKSTPRQLNRKAKQDAMQANILAVAHKHEDIVAESLAPMTVDERGEWESWIEMESEPVSSPPSATAFFLLSTGEMLTDEPLYSSHSST
jgi:hypothetical protein